MTREANARYVERHKNEPEFIERTRKNSRNTSATYRKKMAETMTPEEKKAFRQKENERLRAWRERKKLEKAAAEAAAQESKNAEKDQP